MQQRADLRGIALDALRRAGLQVHEDIRHAGRRVERRQQPRAEIVGQFQQALVAGELIAAEQSAQQADRDLEILDVDVLVERELACR